MSNIIKNDLQLDCIDKFRKLPTLWFFYIYYINWKYDERLRNVLFKFTILGTSLKIQGLRIHLAMQGTKV